MLVTRFIKLVEEATWLLPIVVVPKKNGKLKICVDFGKLNVVIKKDPYPLGRCIVKWLNFGIFTLLISPYKIL